MPRSLDRAKVRPGLDLYETVIAVFPDRVRVLRADRADVTSREAPRGEIVATVLHTNLLVARWTLLLADGGTVEVEYNAVSHPTIAEVNRYVLSREWAAPASSAEVTIPPVTSPPGFTEIVITSGRAVITQPVLAAPDTVADLLTAHGDARTPSTGS